MIQLSCHHGFLSQEIIEKYRAASESIAHTLRQERVSSPISPYIFLRMPDTAQQRVQEIHDIIRSFSGTKPIDIVIVVGIGGSALGTQAVYHALSHHLDSSAPQLWCADTVDPITTHQLINNMQAALARNKNIIVVMISKSGTTLETCANASLCIEVLRTKVTHLKHHVIVITDQGSTLATWAQQEGITCAHIPPTLGGRFSVFSAVGLLPLTLLGIDTTALLRGAQSATDSLMHKTDDLLLQTAMLATAYDAGVVIHDTFVNAPHLIAYGLWYRQLMAESLGKCYNNNTNNVQRVGMTPTVSCISSDLHSMAQLYLAGPARTITTFVDISCNHAQITRMPNSNITHLVPNLNNKSVADVHNALCTGIYTAYREAQLPHLHISSTTCNAETLGFLMQQQMIIISMLGHLWHINPFDQPQVELYKKWARRALAE